MAFLCTLSFNLFIMTLIFYVLWAHSSFYTRIVGHVGGLVMSFSLVVLVVVFMTFV